MLKLTLFMHIMAALFWVGGMLFLTLVIAPFLSTLEPAKKSEIYKIVGTKFRFYGWIAIIILIVTGPLNLYYMGVPFSSLFDPAFHGTPYGRAVMMKLGFVVLLVLSSLFHDFYLGPKARGNRKLSRYAMIFGRSNLVVAILIVIFAVFMRTGG